MALDPNINKRYFLGTVTDAEREELDTRVIESEEFGNELLVAENELIEDYLEGSLSDSEREMFEKHFLVTDERRQRVDEIALLKRYSSGGYRFAATTESKPRRGWFEIRVLVPAFGVLVLAVVGIAIWQAYFSDGRTPLEREFAGLNKGDLSDPGKYRSVQIVPGTFRDGGQPNKLAATSENVLFQLPLTFTPPANAEYRAELSTAGATKFSVESARVYRDGALSEVRLLLPGSVLVGGQYQITLTQKESETAPIVYTFTIE